MYVGVDEAGRGPALGSMFAAAVAVATPEDLPDGIADSKRLTARRREEFADAMADSDAVRSAVVEVPVERIDDPETDMNGLTVDAHARAIEAVAAEVDATVDRTLVDACDVSEERFAARVRTACSPDLPLDARHGADDSDPVVAAASVIAKVRRDEHVADLATRYGEVGSGYPGDATTREFLESYVAEHGDLPDCARRSWGTCRDVLEEAGQSTLDRF